LSLARTTGTYYVMVRDFNGLGTAVGNYSMTAVSLGGGIAQNATATDNLAVEGGFDNGTFTIMRTNIRALPVTVGYAITGTAKNGVDYTTLTGSAIIQPNTGSVNVNVLAIADALKENSETVILTLKTGTNYTLGAAKSATVTIDDGATVSGEVFNDLNGNGVLNSGEGGLSGWTVFIDLNGDGKLDNGERSVVTNANGTFSITGVAPGTYKLRAAPKTGFTQSAPASGGFRSVVLPLGATVSGVQFGEKKIA
jgi:hypothetical protein